MKKIKDLFKILFFIMNTQLAFSQVDVVYNDLVWSDEFDTNGAINSTKWHHQTQLPNGGSWFNGEVQHYTNQQTNSSVNNGFLNIVAKKETFTDQNVTKQYTSARLNSKFAFLYGRVDIRAKVPTNQGTWPALWMLGKNVNEDGGFFDAVYGNTSWPQCGEIDILEHGITPSQPTNYIQSALHTPSSFGNTMNIGGTIVNNLGSDFHIYSINWSPNEISFLLDGVIYYTYNPSVKNSNNWPFNAEQYLLLNIAMGGIAGTIPSNFTQTSMEVDYVRVYQNSLFVPNQNQLNQISFQNPVQDYLIIDSDINIDQVQIYNLLGNLVFKTKSNTKTIDVKNLSKGIYLVVFYSNTIRSVKKIIVN